MTAQDLRRALKATSATSTSKPTAYLVVNIGRWAIHFTTSKSRVLDALKHISSSERVDARVDGDGNVFVGGLAR
jgi:hypothetical protein